MPPTDESLPPASRIVLPPIPAQVADDAVAAWSQPITIDTYFPASPDRLPAHLDNRVYQGSSGRVFPLPFHERISTVKVPHEWQAVHLENEYLRLVVLPELGGRLHIAWDKTAGYDLFYRNNVIKPALVGLSGPWIAGGIEFNWPQHHRPGTFLPTDVSIERESDGAVTVWCSDHDPFARMKGMHGIRLRPESSAIEARVRLYNRSDTQQSFLWWANVAVAVNDDYQSFFPLDVHHVADHAKRAVVSFPAADSPYYGVDYPARAALVPEADRLDWYRNIPVPTSYMVTESADEFFGGYDHGRQAGFVHWAPHDVAPGKKQWTWGNAPFGWSWDAQLSDGDGPYVELMAGVFTDNQPDFAFLAPGETKAFSQFWYPISGLGPAHQASRHLAARLDLLDRPEGGTAGVRLSVVASEAITVLAELRVVDGGLLDARELDLSPATLTTWVVDDSAQHAAHDLVLRLWRHGTPLLKLQHPDARDKEQKPAPVPAVEPPAPGELSSVDELVQVAGYLDQYRHATRSPEPYWREALRRDPEESRATTAIGSLLYSRGEYEAAEQMLQRSVRRRTRWAPTPRSGEAHYLLGLTLSRLSRIDEAVDAFARASWDGAFAVAARFAEARLHSADGARPRAIALLERNVDADPDHLQSADLLALLLRDEGEDVRSSDLLANVLARDPLDQWALRITGAPATSDATIMLDVALEFAAAGFVDQALATLDVAESLVPALALGQVNVGPLLGYQRAALLARSGRAAEAMAALTAAAHVDAERCLPSRLDDIDALRLALRLSPADPLPAALLGNWLYDRHRYDDAATLWQQALAASPSPALSSMLSRNLAIAFYNVRHDGAAARAHYERARAAAPRDEKLLQEFDQLTARLGESSESRLARLLDTPTDRDGLTVTIAGLMVDVGRAAEARQLLLARAFQPWEGGEGQVLGVWDRANIECARSAILTDDAGGAIVFIESALSPPSSLGEARHPLANEAELHLVAGDAYAAQADHASAQKHWRVAAESDGDFARMATVRFSRQGWFSIQAMHRLGETSRAESLRRDLDEWLATTQRAPAKIDYFATSLPSMLLFVDDPSVERDAELAEIRAQLDGPDLREAPTP